MTKAFHNKKNTYNMLLFNLRMSLVHKKTIEAYFRTITCITDLYTIFIISR